MRKLIALAFSVALLAGCVTHPLSSVSEWAQQNEPRVLSGELKHSEYYNGLYEQLARAPNFAGRGQHMEVVNGMIAASYKLENGQIGRAEFDHLTRAAQVRRAQIDERTQPVRPHWSEALRELGSALQGAGAATNTGPRQTTCVTSGAITNCHSR